MKVIKISLACLMMITFSVIRLNAQPPPPQGGSTGAPIDSGVVALLVAVTCYGYMKLKRENELIPKVIEL